MSINGLLIGQTNDDYKKMQRNKNKEFLERFLLPKPELKAQNNSSILPPINKNNSVPFPKFARY